MAVGYQEPRFELDPAARTVIAEFRIANQSETVWRREDGFAVGWQVYDPETGTFIAEGEWQALAHDLAPAENEQVRVELRLPPERGRYHVYISPLNRAGWFFARGDRFLLVDAGVEGGRATLGATLITTLRSLQRRNLRRAAGRAFTRPVLSVWRNRALIRSMVLRDILARYRGSFADAFWTVLNPLLLMVTYFFVFGIVLEARFAADPSRSGFVLYFLAGMLPWLAFSEAAGRAPHVMLEHRNFVKKLVFPLEILPVNQALAGLVTEAFALVIFMAFLVIARGGVPVTAAWLPVLLIPQLLFTLGMGWFLAALGVYVRDLGHLMGFLLTLWFFLTPICYPESALPASAAAILAKNPMYVMVRGYRAIFLEGAAPAFSPLAKLWLLSAAVFLLGHAWFHKLRRSFADVI
ncbi:MAG: ABC transporter permease [Acidobacteria bacterium]|nr:ABC transporter permease [Acidobacteriota bacterium]